MEQGNFMELFGITDQDIKGKKENPKKQAKEKGEKKGKATSNSNKEYDLPIKVCAGHLSLEIMGDGGKTLGEASVKSRIKEEYEELSGFYIKLVEIKRKESEKAGFNTWLTLDLDYEAVGEDQELAFPLAVKAGSEKIAYEEECSQTEVAEDWVANYPEYKGCKFHYDEKKHILIPFMEPNLVHGKAYPLPVTVGYLNCKEGYTGEDFPQGEPSIDAIRTKYVETHPEFKGCDFYYQEEENLLFPIASHTKSDKKVERVALPVSVRAAGFQLDLSSEDFGGRDSVKLEEVRQFMEEDYPEYSKERTEMMYDEKHFIIPILKGSRKGATFISNRKNHYRYLAVARNGARYRVEQRPFGQFVCNEDDGGDVEFHYSGRKFPAEALRSIIEIFRKSPKLESAVQLFLEPKTGDYLLYFPKQTATGGSVAYLRNHEMERENVLVMDAHSHASMPAFFSSTDDEDEKGIRLYLVIGNLDKGRVSYQLRAGLAGRFTGLDVRDVFNLECVERGGVFYGMPV